MTEKGKFYNYKVVTLDEELWAGQVIAILQVWGTGYS